MSSHFYVCANIGWYIFSCKKALILGFISSLPQLAWEKMLCCCCISFVISALLWHRLMGNGVLSIDVIAPRRLRAYAHCRRQQVWDAPLCKLVTYLFKWIAWRVMKILDYSTKLNCYGYFGWLLLDNRFRLLRICSTEIAACLVFSRLDYPF